MAESESESPPLDAEDWQIVFRAYAEYPMLAFILAQHFDCLKGLIQGGPQRVIEAIASLDLAIESLKPHTKFRDADWETYHLAVTGNLSPKDDKENAKRSG
jgi:hypothetical protein